LRFRIFIAVRHSVDPSHFYGALWSNNFYPALRQLGCEIVESQTDLLPASRFMHIAAGFTAEERDTRDRVTERIISEIKDAHANGGIDLVLTYFYNAHFNPQGFSELRDLGIPTVNFYCNSIHQFPLVAEIARAVDFSWHAERDAKSSYVKVGANPVWVQMGADPTKYHPHDWMVRYNRGCFIGTRYADRDRLLAELIRRHIPVDIYGTGWGGIEQTALRRISIETTRAAATKHLGRQSYRPGTAGAYLRAACECLQRDGVVRGIGRLLWRYNYARTTRRLLPLLAQNAKGRADNISETFARYDVVLNFSNVWADTTPGSALIPHVRLRDFEGPMCRTCYITGHSDEIEEFYEVGREIETYRSPAELADKTRFYLAQPDAADTLRNAGYLRAIRDHTWRRRFEQLFRLIGLSRHFTNARTREE
jgi:hypothetical protein